MKRTVKIKSKERIQPIKKHLALELLSLLVGVALFAFVIKLAGLGNILNSVKSFSPQYFIPFMVVTAALFLAATCRWKVVLAGQMADIPVLTLLKYKLVILSINYFTPSARLGGEPLKIVLLRKQKVKSSRSFASIVIDNFIGMGFDGIVGGIVLVILFFTLGAALGEAKRLALAIGLGSLAIVAISYLVLIKKKSAFSYIAEIIGGITNSTHKKFFAVIQKKIAQSEFYMREILAKKPRTLLQAVFFASLSWPLTLLQYKLALLMIGVDASFLQILVSVVVLSFTTLLPVPAALGVQEAGQFTVFGLFSSDPHTGIALSLVLRAKDTILLLLSFLSLSSEGLDIFNLINKKAAKVLSSTKGKLR